MCILFWKKKKPQVDPNMVSVQSVSSADVASIKVSDIYIIEEMEVLPVEDQKKEKAQKYHVSQNKEKDVEHSLMWRVRKEGSEKTIQYFDTQKLAIVYAQGLAERTGSTVVIHKLDGSIRKQDYTKKD